MTRVTTYSEQNIVIQASGTGVTRLGEFLPIGRLVTVGSFLNSKNSLHFFATFFYSYGNALTYITYILGDFLRPRVDVMITICFVIFDKFRRNNWRFSQKPML
jgi:hypothetical protein